MTDAEPAPWRGRHEQVDRWVDLVLTVVLLLTAAFPALPLLTTGAPVAFDAATWLGVASTVVAAVSMLWRRRFPVPVALLAMVLTLPSGNSFLIAAAMVTLATVRRDRVLVILTLLAAVALVPSMALEGKTPGAAVTLVALMEVVFLALPVAFGAYLGARRDFLASLEERAERADAEQQAHLEHAARAERARIAREMHDVLAHRISLVALHAGGLELNPGAGPEKVERDAALIGEQARGALTDLREILGVLRGDDGADPGTDLAPQPTTSGIDRLAESSRAAGTEVELSTELDGDPPELLGRTAYRIVQEGLTNARKHAPGATASVRLGGGPGTALEVEVRTPRAVGRAPATPPPGSGTGLVGLRERVQLLGGTFSATVDERGGFVTRAALPWPS
ncbi:signal transduction histidine kinase [Pseudonocardia sediminis]|uniref:histidine kinase n=1 Tax=Pseudonocardia sediminis TaxID=1397368 RepID=A0A4Q7V7X4_PSEST|nr:sensor histidine kinase [Pseudonocardia sediminis]RZT88879.1 signal transduction histidine kinase [Pseudonocardia sediminis]